MNCLVTIKLLEAPGISAPRMSAIRMILRVGNGTNMKLTVDPTALCSTVFDKAITTVSPSSPESLIPLRIRCNGNDLDLKKTFADNKVTEGAILECQLLVK